MSRYIDITTLSCISTQGSLDLLKQDLELTCDKCDANLCDVEAGDSLPALIDTAVGHLGVCPKRPLPVQDVPQ